MHGKCYLTEQQTTLNSKTEHQKTGIQQMLTYQANYQ